jgi:beta-lactamase superfamily II metal-dependent hydrolase
MKLRIFQSEKGDCILLESNDGRLILCDGGMANSMKAVVRQELAKYREKNREIDYAYVSHIDQDHISGLLVLLEDELVWRVYDHHTANNDQVKPPKVPRPPKIGGIWHNAFHVQIGKNSGPIAELLAAGAPALLATGIPKYMEAGEEFYQIATSIPEAIKVSRLASADLLDIPLNKLPGSNEVAKLLMIRDSNKPFEVGSLTFTIVGPTGDELKKLRDGWNTWLRANKEKVKQVEKQLKKKIDEFSNSAGAPVQIDLRDWNGIPDYEGVTAPNIASLMFMVEEDGKRLLLTGDSQQDIILKGLEKTGYLADGYLHLDVLKMPHHGSENNFNADIASTISADHYVFCGNGQHENPNLDVVDFVFNSRMERKHKARAPEAGRKFTMWFSTEGDGKAQAHMKKLRKHVDDLVKKSNGKMKAVFNKSASVTLNV